MSCGIKGINMLTIPGNARLFICHHRVSMRKSFEGLSEIVEELFPSKLLSGAGGAEGKTDASNVWPFC
jgi:hypothetical protein